jgi:hypothetical protein
MLIINMHAAYPIPARLSVEERFKKLMFMSGSGVIMDSGASPGKPGEHLFT